MVEVTATGPVHERSAILAAPSKMGPRWVVVARPSDPIGRGPDSPQGFGSDLPFARQPAAHEGRDDEVGP